MISTRRRRMVAESLKDLRMLAAFEVVTAGDAGLGLCSATNCTLRDAIIAANDFVGADEIRVAASITETITLDPTAGALLITDPVSIVGPGEGQLRIHADTSIREFRVLDVTTGGGDVSIEGLHLSGGRVPSDAGGAIRLLSSGTLSLNRSTLSGNFAANGGGIYSGSVGKIEITESSISGNTAAHGDAGGIQNMHGDITVESSTIDGNQAFNSGGGIVNRYGNTTITDSQINGNEVLYPGYQGGGISSGEGNLIGGSPHPVIDAGVATLAFNGGENETHAPLLDSLALDHGRTAFLSADVFDADGDGDRAESLPVDQRGAARVTGVEMDIGAVELPPAANVTWNQPADIVLGTALGTAQLNASADVAGTFEYAPPAGTILDVGDGQLLTAVFAPDDLLAFRLTFVSTRINVMVNTDFGDAPGRYPVTLADNGARHFSNPLRLGSEVDTEPDGQPDDLAGGDGDDDDGITRLADLVAGGLSTNTSSFWAVASALGRLDAWVDFNADGDWNDLREPIATGITLLPGGNTISFTVPSDAKVGDTAARFRLSIGGNLSPTGPAVDGEVEDYLLTILDGSMAPNVAVRLPQQRAAIRAGQGRLFVSEGPIELLGVARTDISQLRVLGGSDDDTIIVDLNQDDMRDQLEVDGMTGSNTLALIGEGATIDFNTSGNTRANHFARIDISDLGVQSVTIDAAAISELSPSTQAVSVVGGEGDKVNFRDVGRWSVVEPQIIEGRFLRIVNYELGNQSVQLDLPNPWQNPLEPSDIGADGAVTAGDALPVINELSRRVYSDAITKNLDGPLTTTHWPGVYYDQNGDGRATALDALRVINQLTRISNGEGEAGQLRPATPQFRQASRTTDATAIDHDHTILRAVAAVRNSNEPLTATDADTKKYRTASALSDQLRDTDRSASLPIERLVDELLSSQRFVADLFDATRIIGGLSVDEALD